MGSQSNIYNYGLLNKYTGPRKSYLVHVNPLRSRNWFIDDSCNLLLHGIRTEEKYQIAIAVHVKSLKIKIFGS